MQAAQRHFGTALSAQDYEIVRISDEASAEAPLKPELLENRLIGAG
jgi:hypothetical protein